MINQNTIFIEEHGQFLESLKADRTKQYFLTKYDNKNIGVIDFYNIEPNGTYCYYGYYLNFELIGSAYGLLLEYLVIEYGFDQLKRSKLIAETMHSNTSAIELHKRFGFIETTTNQRGLIEAYITPDIWSQHKPHIEPLIKRILGK